MLTVEVVNLAPFQSAMAREYPNAVKHGTGEGVKRFADVFAADVRGAVPSKSGRTRSSIRSRMVNKLTAAVGYDRKVAWYARFVDLGTKPHPIFAKGLKGSKATKQVSRLYRKYARGSKLLPGGKTQKNTGAWGTAITREEISEFGLTRFTSGGLSGKFAKALHFGNRFAAHVMHSGIKAAHTLKSRLDATKSQAPEILRQAIRIEIQRERG